MDERRVIAAMENNELTLRDDKIFDLESQLTAANEREARMREIVQRLGNQLMHSDSMLSLLASRVTILWGTTGIPQQYEVDQISGGSRKLHKEITALLTGQPSDLCVVRRDKLETILDNWVEGSPGSTTSETLEAYAYLRDTLEPKP